MSNDQGHVVHKTLDENVRYPTHDKRKATALYNKSHKKLIITLDTPCRICGVKHSTLNDPTQNRWGAIQMETHHYYIEDSLANAIDLNKFNTRMLPYLRKRFPNRPLYKTDFTQDQMLEWIHGDEHALMVLCNVHHRSPLTGIHSITYPIWAVQDLIIDNFDLTGFHAESKEEAKHLTGLPVTKGEAE